MTEPWTPGDMRWDSETMTARFVLVYRDLPMPRRIREKRGRRGRRMRRAWCRKQIVDIVDLS